MKRLALAAAVAWASFGGDAVALAAEGVPDPSFGSGGLATYELGMEGRGRRSAFSALGTGPDGKIYAAGESLSEQTGVVLVVRLAANGALDTSFGGGGVVRGAAPGGEYAAERATAMSVEPNGVTVAGASVQSFPHEPVRRTTAGFIERLTASGTRDTTFKPGSLALDPGALQRLPHGSLLAVGERLEGPPETVKAPRVPALVEMLTPSGPPDPRFGHRGVVELFDDFDERSEMRATSMLRQPDGDLIISGSGSYETGTTWVSSETTWFYWLARLTPSGSLDRTFGESGMLFSIGPDGLPGDLVEPRPGGGLAVLGTTPSQTNHRELAVWGLTGNGALDHSFGSGGELTVSAAGGPTAATVDQAGRLLIAGEWGLESGAAIIRVTPSGAVDKSFGQEGMALGPRKSVFRALAVEPSGNVLAAGSLTPETPDPSDGGWLEKHGLQEDDSLIERFLATNGHNAGAAQQSGLSVASPRIAVSRVGRMRIRLACAGASACRGTLTITTTGKPRSTRRTPTVIGTGPFALAASHEAAIGLSLTHEGSKLLRSRHGRLEARLRVQTVEPSPPQTQVKRVLLLRIRQHRRSTRPGHH